MSDELPYQIIHKHAHYDKALFIDQGINIDLARGCVAQLIEHLACIGGPRIDPETGMAFHVQGACYLHAYVKNDAYCVMVWEPLSD